MNQALYAHMNNKRKMKKNNLEHVCGQWKRNHRVSLKNNR
jgi:ribosomal protein L32